MAIKRSQEVFNLIQSMSSSEKAYFKKLFSGKKSRNFTEAFDIINAAKEYNEEVLNEQLVAKDILPATLYKRLIPAILKSMRQYFSESTDELTLNEIYSSVSILFMKNQFTLCEEQVEKGLQLARQTGSPYFELMFLSWKERLRLRQKSRDIEETEKSYQEMCSSISNISALVDYDYLRQRVAVFLRENDTTLSGRQHFIDTILKHPILQKEPTGKYLPEYYSIVCPVYYFTGDWEACVQTSKKALDTGPQINALEGAAYMQKMMFMLNTCILLILLYQREEYEKLAEEIEKGLGNDLLKTNQHYKDTFEFTYAMLKLQHLIYSGKLTEALELAKSKENNLPNIIKQTPNNVFILQTIVSKIHFLRTDYGKCISILNTLLADSQFKQEAYLNEAVRWEELFCYFMNKDEGLFESRWLAQSRYIKKTNTGYAWEGMILKALKEAFNTGQEVQKEIFTDLYNKLQNSKEEVRTRLRGFYIMPWVESIMLGKPIAILMKEKYLGQTST